MTHANTRTTQTQGQLVPFASWTRCARARVVLTPPPLVVPKPVPGALPVEGHPVLGAKDVKAASLA